jgi:broad specificity phosphatase PhoE
MRRLLLVRHAPTGATRATAFPRDEPLDERAIVAAAALAAAIPRGCEVLSSPALRCLQTAEAAGLTATPEPRLSECDFGRWAGSTLAEVHAADPDAARSWMLDPDAAPHDGEPLTAFTERVAEWLDDQAQRPGTITAITHAGVVKAAVVYALGAPMSAFWQIDAAPLSLTEMHAHDGCWTVTRVNCLLGGGAP